MLESLCGIELLPKIKVLSAFGNNISNLQETISYLKQCEVKNELIKDNRIGHKWKPMYERKARKIQNNTGTVSYKVVGPEVSNRHRQEFIKEIKEQRV